MKKNLWLKIASVVLAVSMWLFVMAKGQTEVTRRVQVLYENIPVGLVVTNGKVRSMDVDLKGHARAVKRLRDEEVRAIISLEGLKPGENLITLTSNMVEVPSSLSVLAMRPDTLNLTAEATVRKSVPLKATLIGRPMKGFYITDIIVKPSEVTLRGSKSDIDRVGFILTRPVDVSASTGDVTGQVALEGLGATLVAETATVSVIIVIEKGR